MNNKKILFLISIISISLLFCFDVYSSGMVFCPYCFGNNVDIVRSEYGICECIDCGGFFYVTDEGKVYTNHGVMDIQEILENEKVQKIIKEFDDKNENVEKKDGTEKVNSTEVRSKNEDDEEDDEEDDDGISYYGEEPEEDIIETSKREENDNIIETTGVSETLELHSENDIIVTQSEILNKKDDSDKDENVGYSLEESSNNDKNIDKNNQKSSNNIIVLIIVSILVVISFVIAVVLYYMNVKTKKKSEINKNNKK